MPRKVVLAIFARFGAFVLLVRCDHFAVAAPFSRRRVGFLQDPHDLLGGGSALPHRVSAGGPTINAWISFRLSHDPYHAAGKYGRRCWWKAQRQRYKGYIVLSQTMTTTLKDGADVNGFLLTLQHELADETDHLLGNKATGPGADLDGDHLAGFGGNANSKFRRVRELGQWT
jgi:hypothetical protein